MGRWSRRSVLAGLAGALTLSGCQQVRPESGSRRTLTPAAVPDADEPRGQPTPAAADCPRLPSHAEVYICSPNVDRDSNLRLVPETTEYSVGTGGLVFTLVNRTDSEFRTGRDWWTLTAHRRDGWDTVGRGARTDDVVVEPGGVFVWILGGQPPDDDVPRLDVDFGWGPHALVVTGYAAGGTLTAVIAPIQVTPYLG